MSWPDVVQDGYKLVPNIKKDGGNLWNSDEQADSLQSCKAVCNANSRCKSIGWEKSQKKCFLKTHTEDEGGFSNDANWETWFKQGEPALDKKLFIRDANKTPVNSWRGRGMYDISSGGCEDGAVNVGGCGSGRDDTCSLVPIATQMCPQIGDLVYFRHEQIGSGIVESYDWGAWARDSTGGERRYCTRFSDAGSRLDAHENAPILCGYNRIDKDKWADLVSRYGFTENEKNKVIKEHCEGPGITSKELAADSTYCGAMMMNKSQYNQAILEKLKTEPNWWNDRINCENFSTIVVGNTSDQSVMRVAGELVDSLPNTGWSDDLVKAINAIKNGVSGAIDGKLDDKSKSFCDASSGDTNSKCGCRNAVKYGKLRQCRNEIQGCTDVKRSYDLIDKAKGIDAGFGNQLESIYDPNFDSDACKNTLEPSSTILNIGNLQRRDFNIAACFNAIENSGTITGDVSTKCNASIQLYNENKSGGTSSSDGKKTSTDDDDKLFVSGETAGVKNDVWLILLCCCFIVFLIIGVGLAAVVI